MAIYEVTLINPREPGRRQQYVQRYLVQAETVAEAGRKVADENAYKKGAIVRVLCEVDFTSPVYQSSNHLDRKDVEQRHVALHETVVL